MGDTEARRWSVTKRDDTSNKFYEAYLIQHDRYGWIIAFHWGRIGAPKGQWQAFTDTVYTDAVAAIHTKINSKIQRGYEERPLDRGTFTDLTNYTMMMIEDNLYLGDGTPPIFKSVEEANQWLEKQ